MDNLRELSHEFEKFMMATNGVEDVGKECPQDLAHDEVQPNLDGEKPILDPPHVRKKGITNARIKSQLEKKKRKKVKDASTSQAPQSTSMLQEIQVKKMRRSVKDATSSQAQAPQASSMTHGNVQVSFIPQEMSIAYPMFSSTKMHQQIQVEEMRSGKYATSSQAPQASSMIHGDVQSSFILPEMSIVYPMFSSTRMNQEIQVEKVRRSGKDAASSQAPQVRSMIHVAAIQWATQFTY
ncbi:hypothetical protein SO802_022168 [Lithocarpus litseifolius]|uniref:Uncharacterized protein n=1 Tax=Lithocarpus litseifolius TaxID=425828 RepID=A0AAW2CH60_9ROSI